MSTTVPLPLRNPGHLAGLGDTFKSHLGHLYDKPGIGDKSKMTQVLCNTGNLAEFPLGLPNVTQVEILCDQQILNSTIIFLSNQAQTC